MIILVTREPKIFSSAESAPVAGSADSSAATAAAIIRGSRGKDIAPPYPIVAAAATAIAAGFPTLPCLWRCAIAQVRGHRSAMVNLMAFTIGDTNMLNRSKIIDVVLLSLFFLMAALVTFSGVLGPSPLSWLR